MAAWTAHCASLAGLSCALDACEDSLGCEELAVLRDLASALSQAKSAAKRLIVRAEPGSSFRSSTADRLAQELEDLSLSAASHAA